MDGGTKEVYLRGNVMNRGDRNIANIEARIRYISKAKPGEKRVESVKLGSFNANQNKTGIEIRLYVAKTSPQYTITLQNLKFR